MTSEAPVWEPSEVSFEDQEDSMNDFRGEVMRNETITRGWRIIDYLSTGKENVVDFIDDKKFFDVCNAKVIVARVGV